MHEQYDYIYKNKLNKYESCEGKVIQIKKDPDSLLKFQNYTVYQIKNYIVSEMR